MKVRLLLSLAYLSLLSLSGCFEKDPDKNPEPDQPKNFTGCRLVKRTYTLDASSNGFSFSNVFHYDQNGNIIREDEVGKNGALSTSRFYDYNSQGQLIKFRNDFGEKEYFYDNAGNLIAEYEIGGGNRYLRSKLKYNVNNLLDTMYVYEWSDPAGFYRQFWTYDYYPNGNLKQENYFVMNSNGTVDSLRFAEFTEFEAYDNFKNPVTQPNFTLRQLRPQNLQTKNNITKLFGTIGSPQKINYLYKYRADSLITEEYGIESDRKIEYFYDCN